MHVKYVCNAYAKYHIVSRKTVREVDCTVCYYFSLTNDICIKMAKFTKLCFDFFQHRNSSARHSDGWTDGQCENGTPHHKHSLGGYN